MQEEHRAAEDQNRREGGKRASSLEIGEIFATAVRSFSRNWRVLVAADLISALSLGLPFVPIYFSPTPRLRWALFICSLVFGALLNSYVRAGLARLWVRAARGEVVRFSELFRGGRRVWSLLGVHLLGGAPLFIGTAVVASDIVRTGAPSLWHCLLFGALASASLLLKLLGLSFAPFYAVDAQEDPFRALGHAWSACRGERLRLLAVGVMALLLIQAGLLAFGVGIFLVGPVMNIAAAALYVRLSGRTASDDDDERVGFQGYAMPTALWVCGAFYVHFLLFAGGEAIGRAYDDRARLQSLLARAIARTSMSESSLEVSLNETPAEPVVKDETKNEEEKEKEKEKEAEKEKAKEEKKKVAEAEKPKPEEKKKKEEKTIVIKEEEKKAPPVLLDPIQDTRIAVRQHAQKKQEPNPEAKFIADEANHVENETVATQTSHDQDDPNPTPGGNHSGPDQRPGDSDQTKVAESEEHKGEKNRAPGEKGQEHDPQKEPMPKNPAPVAVEAPPKPAQTARDEKPANTPPKIATPQPTQGGQAPSTPEVQQGAGNPSWAFNWVKPGDTAAHPGVAGSNEGNPAPRATVTSPMFGLNRGPAQPGQMNLNLNQNTAVAVVGQDTLRKMRFADGERRKSEHRGSWHASNFERWRNAIENYVSSVKPGNQTALNTAAVPFASYLNAMHNRIHPIFADTFLASLDSLPKDHPLNDLKRVTRLEIVLTKEGRLRKMGIVKASGITQFDVAALDSVDRAQPFGPAPSAIVSPDGNVYLHWEFWRDEVFACSTMHARPFILKGAPQPEQEVPPPPGAPPGPSKERGLPPPPNSPDLRHGEAPNLVPWMARRSLN